MQKQTDNQQQKELMELKEQLHRLQKTILIYEQLAESVRTAHVIDASIYTGEDSSNWLSIDREDYAKIMEILSQLDLWRPWKRNIPQRIN